MKKMYTAIRSLTAALCLLSFGATAQLNGGLYTIDSNSPTAGTNFQTFSDMVTILNNLGVSGPVTVNVVPSSGPYNEQFSINQIAGSSAINNVIINGNGCTVAWTVTNTALPYVIRFAGADYVTLNNITFNGSGGTIYTLLMYNQSDNNAFNNCNFSVPVNATSSSQQPIVISASGTTYGSTGLNSANNNTFQTCTTNWGYFAVTIYGLTGTPYQTGNQFLNCTFKNFYIYGMYQYYTKDHIVKGCTFHRMQATTSTTTYGIYGYYTQGLLIDGNYIRNLYDLTPTINAACFPVYLNYNPVTGVGSWENVVRNNIISDIVHYGYVYGIYFYNANGRVYHNTINIQAPNNTYTGTDYLMYIYATAGSAPCDVKNNIVMWNIGGSASKYGIYYSTTSGVTCGRNDILYTNSGGVNYAGYYNGACTSVANMQTNGGEQGSISVDPIFVNPSLLNYLPLNMLLQAVGANVGVQFDILGSSRNVPAPVPGAVENWAVQCTGNPNASAITPSVFNSCPSYTNAPMGFATSYTNGGLQFQWYSSTVSPVGPFSTVSVGNGTQGIYNTPTLGVTTWYQAIVTCTNGGGQATSGTSQFVVNGTTTNNVTYFEDFEGLGLNNRLPNCSWAASNLGGANQTFTVPGANFRVAHSGTKYATFYFQPSGQSYYYSNGIYMVPGISYSAGLWYISEPYANFTDLSIFVGPNQSTTGQQLVASTNGPAVTQTYKTLGGVFQVSSPGFYYVGIRGTATGGSAQYLTWDDLTVNIPCTAQLNSPNMNINLSTATSTVCANTTLSLTATGADSYTWSTGQQSSIIGYTPQVNANNTLVVTGTSTLTGCTSQVSKAITVKPSPNVTAIAYPPVVCSGKNVALMANNASSYVWSSGANQQNTNVAPTTSQCYTVNGTAGGCTGKAVVCVQVNPLPNVSAVALTGVVCLGDLIQLTASGATNFQWISNMNSNVMVGSSPQTIASLLGNITFTATGTDNNGCAKESQAIVSVEACEGLTTVSADGNISLYPNPTSGNITVKSSKAVDMNISITDLTGRVVFVAAGSNGSADVNVSTLAAGVYYVNINGGESSQVVKLVKE